MSTTRHVPVPRDANAATPSRLHMDAASRDPHRGSTSLVAMMLSQAIADAAEARTRAAVMLIGFESACGEHGEPPCWPRAIRAIAERIGQRPSEWAPLQLDARLLVVVGSGFRSGQAVAERARELLDAVNANCRACKLANAPACAVGIGMFPEDGATWQELLRRAREALADFHSVHRSAAGFSLRRIVHARAPLPAVAQPAMNGIAGR